MTEPSFKVGERVMIEDHVLFTGERGYIASEVGRNPYGSSAGHEIRFDAEARVGNGQTYFVEMRHIVLSVTAQIRRRDSRVPSR